jgi:hypothetical protein
MCNYGKSGADLNTRRASLQACWFVTACDCGFSLVGCGAIELEGRLYDLLSAAALSELRNEVRPVDDTLPAHEVRWLENAVEPIARLLRLLGHDCATESESLESDATGSRNRFYGVTVAKLIERGLLTGNEQLVSTFATVVASASIYPDGTISYNGISYSSPSAAAAARGGASNGWDVWAVPTANGKVKLSTYRARFLEK